MYYIELVEDLGDAVPIHNGSVFVAQIPRIGEHVLGLDAALYEVQGVAVVAELHWAKMSGELMPSKAQARVAVKRA
jgi:hypothetical protein